MPRPVNSVPTYRHHRQFGNAIVTLRTPSGGRRDVMLGQYNTAESKAEYARIIAELQL